MLSYRYTLIAISVGISGGVSGVGTGYWIEVQGFVPASCFAVITSSLAIVLVPLIPTIQPSELIDSVAESTEIYEQNSSIAKDVKSVCNVITYSTTQVKAIWRVYTTEKSICPLCHIGK